MTTTDLALLELMSERARELFITVRLRKDNRLLVCGSTRPSPDTLRAALELYGLGLIEEWELQQGEALMSERGEQLAELYFMDTHGESARDYLIRLAEEQRVSEEKTRKLEDEILQERFGASLAGLTDAQTLTVSVGELRELIWAGAPFA